MGDIKAFAYGVLRWTENELENASIDYFINTVIGYNHNQLYEMQITNNLNKRLCYGIAEIMTAKKQIKLEPIFKLFDIPIEDLEQELNQVSNKIPSSI